MTAKSRRSIIVIDNFYHDPYAIRNYALKQSYYTPYQDEEAVYAGRVRATWWASRFRRYEDCPFKSSKRFINALENAVGEPIDMNDWCAPYPVNLASKPELSSTESPHSSLWNCCFHVKPDNNQRLGDGIHSHTDADSWNAAGTDGWAGIIYLSPRPPLEGGLHLWRNINPLRQYDWMTPAHNWELVDSFANLFNRLILVRGDVPHSGACGWGDSLETGRMFQTFFFRTTIKQGIWPVVLPEIGA